MANGGAPFVNQITNPTTVQASAQFIPGTELFQEAVKKGWGPSPNVNTANALTDFAAGKIPMMGGGQWLAATLLQDHPNFKWGFVPDPSVSSGTAYYDAVGIGSPPWQTQANNVVTADWNKILSSGSGSSAGAINSMLSSLRTAMQSSQ